MPGWSKVLAGDPLACGPLDLARTLSVDDLDAAITNGNATDSLLFTGGRDAVWI